MKSNNPKILVIISLWPSKLSPYLTMLYPDLLNKIENLDFFMFKEGDDTGASELIDKEVLKKVFSKTKFRSNPYKLTQYFWAFFSIIKNWSSAFRLLKYSLLEKSKPHQAWGQLFYNHKLLGKKFDLVYINALQSARHFCLRGLFPNTPIIASSRGQDFDFEPDGFDKVLTQIDHLHVLGEYLKEKAVSRGFSPYQITIIPPAALPAKFQIDHLVKSDKKITITSASRLAWTKGYIYSLSAVSMVIHQLPDINISYHIIGDGPEKEFLQVEAVRLGIQNNVVFHGWKSQKEVNELVSIADIYLLLSIEEGFNNSVLQAQNLGIPCVVSDTGGLPENVEDGVTGLVVPRYDSHAAAEAILKLIQAPELRKKMGEAASQRVKQHFSLEKQVQRYADMFEKVIQNYEDHIRLQ